MKYKFKRSLNQLSNFGRCVMKRERFIVIVILAVLTFSCCKKPSELFQLQREYAVTLNVLKSIHLSDSVCNNFFANRQIHLKGPIDCLSEEEFMFNKNHADSLYELKKNIMEAEKWFYEIQTRIIKQDSVLVLLGEKINKYRSDATIVSALRHESEKIHELKMDDERELREAQFHLKELKEKLGF